MIGDLPQNNPRVGYRRKELANCSLLSQAGGRSMRIIIPAPCFCACLKFPIISFSNVEGEWMRTWENAIVVGGRRE